MRKHKCLTPGAWYSASHLPPNSFRNPVVKFSVTLPVGMKVTARKMRGMEKAFHAALENEMAQWWPKAPAASQAPGAGGEG